MPLSPDEIMISLLSVLWNPSQWGQCHAPFPSNFTKFLMLGFISSIPVAIITYLHLTEILLLSVVNKKISLYLLTFSIFSLITFMDLYCITSFQAFLISCVGQTFSFPKYPWTCLVTEFRVFPLPKITVGLIYLPSSNAEDNPANLPPIIATPTFFPHCYYSPSSYYLVLYHSL